MTQPPKQFDPVAEYLQGQGCPSHVVRAGLKGLVMGWEKVVHELVFDGYRYGLRDFAGDLWRRQLLEGAVRHVESRPDRTVPEPLRARITTSDERFRGATRPSSRSLREVVPSPSPDRPPPAATDTSGGSADEGAWWFLRLPRRHRANFARDLESAGIQALDEPGPPSTAPPEPREPACCDAATAKPQPTAGAPMPLPVVGKAHEAGAAAAPFHWFIYGSSLDAGAFAVWAEQHGYRVPDFAAAVPARLADHRLAFDVESRFWGGTVATVTPAPGESVEGIALPLPADARGLVDHKEGAISGLFEAFEAEVLPLRGGPPIRTLVFRAPHSRRLSAERPPARTFLDTLINGARAHHLSPEWLAKLQALRS